MITVLVVDDSALARRMVIKSLTGRTDIDVIGTAANGQEAIAEATRLKPDAITLDIAMPVMGGLEALEVLHAEHPTVPVIMFSSLTEAGAEETLQALARGASGYVTKPAGAASVAAAMGAVREQLIPQLLALTGRAPSELPAVSEPAPPPVTPPRRRATPVELIVVGASTGGPDALAEVLRALPPDLGVPILVAQHMPPVFTAVLARRLDRSCALRVREAADGDPLRPGEVLLAPGDFHLRVQRGAFESLARLDQGPMHHFCRPAADPLFCSAAEQYGEGVVAVVLTGMGHDGRDGTRAVREAGGTVIVQDRDSSVVWGMPGAVVEAGLAEEVLSLADLPGRLAMMVHARNRPHNPTKRT